MADKPWSGRFAEKTDRRVEAFTESISFDRRLFKQDIRGLDRACADAPAGRIADRPMNAGKLSEVLSEIQAEIESGRFAFVLEREDVHMHIEAALVEKLGDVGRKLHTARSRNDQVATGVKLWTREAHRPGRRRSGRLAAGPGGVGGAAPRR